jgi:hypothetical protein
MRSMAAAAVELSSFSERELATLLWWQAQWRSCGSLVTPFHLRRCHFFLLDLLSRKTSAKLHFHFTEDHA